MCKYITVIGSSRVINERIKNIAYSIGLELAKHNVILVCGGRGGVMEYAAKGMKDGGGKTIGILPGMDRGEANPYIDIAIPTGLGHARNMINILIGDGVIVVAGGPGTLTEIGYALIFGKRVIVIKGSGGVADILADKVIDGKKIYSAETPSQAVKMILAKEIY